MTTGIASGAERIQKTSVPSSPTYASTRQSSPSLSQSAFAAVSIPQIAGNLAIQRLMGAGVLQARPIISQPGDIYEQEAERIAHQVASSMPMLQHKHVPEAATVDRSPMESDEPGLRKTPPEEGSVHASSGHALDRETRTALEPQFRTDFSQVRVHYDHNAGEAARAVQARAFTVRGDIVFGHGEYAPRTPDGRRLLAHELTHVVQQRQGEHIGSARVQRDHQAATVAPLSPRDAFLLAAEQLDAFALVLFQNAVDELNDAGVRQAGTAVNALWQRLESSRQQLTGPIMTPSTPLASPENPLAPDLHRVYEEARRKVLVGVSTQQFQNRFVLGSQRVPRYDADLSMFIQEQTEDVAWVIRDTAALVALLGHADLTEPEQWTAVGLLRQHMNPWNFAYIQAVLAARGMGGRPERFAEAPRRAYIQLLESQVQIRMTGDVQPSEGMGTLALIPTESKIRLLQPYSPMELAEMLYGDADKWQTHLVPYNAALLQGVGGHDWLLLGTELIVDADLLVSRFRRVFLSAARVRRSALAGGTEPYLWAQPAAAAVVGNTVRFGVSWPNTAFADVNLQWWVENDPLAVRERGLPPQIQGPRGVLRWGGRSENDTFEARAAAPGNHLIKCRLTHPNGQVEVLSYPQTVMTLEQKTTLEFERDFTWNISTRETLENLRRERAELQGESTRRDELDQRIHAMEEALSEANEDARRYSGHQAHMNPVRAVYVSADEQPMSVPLTIYVGVDPGYFDDIHNRHLKLWDFTLQGSVRNYTGVGPRPMDALHDLLASFSDDAPYPRGNIRFEITSTTLYDSRVYPETVTYPTDGGTRLAAALRAISMGTLAIGVGAAFLLQPEVAIPAFVISGLLAGAAGTFSLWDRLEHGDFAWDVQTGMDILDIAGALLTAGAASGVTGTVRNVGRMTLVEGVQLGVGGAQLGLMAGVHLVRIKAAIESGDQDRVAEALLRAVADGALVLIVHRAGARLTTEPLPGADRPSARLPGVFDRPVWFERLPEYMQQDLLANPPAMDPERTAQMQEMIRQYRGRSIVPRRIDQPGGAVQGGTVAIAQTDVPTLSERNFPGASREALPQEMVGRPGTTGGNVLVPANPVAANHAEHVSLENLRAAIDSALEQGTLQRSALRGRTVYLLVEQEPCSSCASGAGGGRPGVIEQFSARYPELTIEVRNIRTSRAYIHRGGRLLNP